MEATGTSAKQAVHVYFDPETIARLEKLAQRQDRSKGYFVRQAVDLYLAELDALQVGGDEALQCQK